MATTYAGAVIDALVTTLRANAAFRDPAGSASLDLPAVYDGPEIDLTDGVPFEDYVVIGNAEESESGSSSQVAVTVGTTRQRDEVGTLHCVAVAQIGDSDFGDVKMARDLALGYVAQVEAALHADPWLGITGARFLVVEFGGVTSLQQFIRTGSGTSTGLMCWVEFDINYTARL